MSDIKDKNDILNLKVLKAEEQSNKLKEQFTEMMGDAGSMQQFVGNTGKDVTNLKRRLNILEIQHEKLVEASDTRMLKTEKILIETEKRSV